MLSPDISVEYSLAKLPYDVSVKSISGIIYNFFSLALLSVFVFIILLKWIFHHRQSIFSDDVDDFADRKRNYD